MNFINIKVSKIVHKIYVFFFRTYINFISLKSVKNSSQDGYTCLSNKKSAMPNIQSFLVALSFTTTDIMDDKFIYTKTLFSCINK